MKRSSVLFSCLLFSIPVLASETVGWKVPLSRYTAQEPEKSGAVRMDKPPGPSAFFQEGDELWDLSSLPKDSSGAKGPGLEWLVWNATQGRLVAKGGWGGLSKLHEKLEPWNVPTLIRLTLQAFEVPPGAPPFSPGAPPAAELKLVSRSGLIVDGSLAEGEKYVASRFSGNSAPWSKWLEIDGIFEARLPGQLVTSVDCCWLAQEGRPVWFARDFNGEKGVDLVASAEILLADGSPAREFVEIETGGKRVSMWPVESMPEGPVKLKDGRWLYVKEVTDDLWQLVAGESGEAPGGDPFDADELKKGLFAFPESPEASPPEILRSRLGHEVLDARELLKRGIPDHVGKLDFAGYDPFTGLLHVISPSESAIGEVESLFMTLDGGMRQMATVSLNGNGQKRLIGYYGMKARLAQREEVREDEDKEPKFLWEVEPTLDGEDVADLRMVLEDRRDPARSIDLKQALAVEIGKPLEMMTGDAGTDARKAISVTVENLVLEP